MAKPLHPEAMAQAQRMTLRRVAATLVSCMAESDMDFAAIAKRLGKEEAEVRQWVYDFIDAKSVQDDMRRLAEFALATGHILEPKVQPVRMVVDDAKSREAA